MTYKLKEFIQKCCGEGVYLKDLKEFGIKTAELNYLLECAYLFYDEENKIFKWTT